MEVTRTNFNELLDDISNAIKQASFIAFDAEFTGLEDTKQGHALPFDTPEERYTKLRKGSLDFLVLQFGLCTFKYDNKKKRHIAQPFNFYVFPKPYSRQAPDRRFMCQSSSIDFLVSQGFDFNKVFCEGIPYLTPTQENTLKDTIEQKHLLHAQFSSPAFTSPHGQDIGPNKGPIAIPDDQKSFINGIVDQISIFMEKSEEESLNLPVCNGFQRKLIYQTVRNKFSAVHLEAKKGEKKDRYICVTKISGEEEMKMREGAKQAAERAEIDDAVGFSKVVRMLSQSGKLLVGHNMLLDVMHTINQFHFPLPEEYEDFKSMTKCIFPKLVDTKLMAQTHPFKDHIPVSVLGDLHKTLSFKPFELAEVEFPKGYTNYNDNDKYHEAGYDAFVTGLCFASMKNFLGSFQKPPKDFVSPSSPLVEPFMNKLFLMRNFEVPYMNLNGADLTANRDHVFHMTFPKDWKSNDISNLFSAHGNVQIFWLDDTTALVALYKKENSKSAYDDLQVQKSNFTIQKYKDFLSSSNGEKNKNSHNKSTVRKRSHNETDIDVPSKKKKTLNVAAQPFVCKQPDVISEGDDSSNTSNTSTTDVTMTDSTHNKLIDVKEDVKEADKLFEETAAW
ncbi:hypothetical protein SNE40_018712 [Patella caerulea]|uniref:Poly(A)-specific ribonuclease PARN n=1 Tax=Patella caerulea TaxID=87958 RepID=A0AAN8J6C1_PATCE